MDTMEMGKRAERIIEDMLKETGYKVIKYGYEHTVPQLADKRNLIQGEAARYIRHQPDFVIVNKNNEAFFIEVKYRKEGIVRKEHLFNYPNTYVVLITKDGIWGQTLRNIHQYDEDDFKPLTRLAPFARLPNNTIRKYVKRAKRELGEENLIGQAIEAVAEKVVNKRFFQTKTRARVETTYTAPNFHANRNGQKRNKGHQRLHKRH